MSDNKRIIIFDTTLRDGEQSPGASMTIFEKIQLAHQLQKLGVDIIEAGFPVISKGDFEAVNQIARQVKGPKICALARAKAQDIEAAAAALEPATNKRIHTFIATSDIHMKYKLKMTREQVVLQAVAAVKKAKTYVDDVEFSAEDAARSDPNFLFQVLEAVISAGATTVNIPDTVGYSTPLEFAQLIKSIKDNVPNIESAAISVHCHNDLGLASANSLAAVEAGAEQVECTVNGIGERSGNCALEEIVMALNTRSDVFGHKTRIDTKQLVPSSKMVESFTGINVQPNKAIVGRNAFAHEAGIHQHGVIANRGTYEIMRAEDVGFESNEFVLGKHSGRHAMKLWLSRNNIRLADDEVAALSESVKSLCDQKKRITDSDVFAILKETQQEAVAMAEPTHFMETRRW
ncbi:2-isopropylmalate synthase [Aliikangiella marina]|uniref:2-isopropylmalate synthase n=1 Tax=Aliikangiella marina TaxID=1712262 RepID=A0A545TDK0_9GAMM|nr:2-isopropylmalate synthase [Aliikangiella marina]TQV75290.1 2-isopropylmalate synthase [Aliikangiella marina]